MAGFRNVGLRLGHSVGECGPNGRSCLKSTEYDDGRNRGSSEFGGYVGRNSGEPENANIDTASSGSHRFKLFSAVMLQAEIEVLATRRPLEDIGVSFELIANRGADEIGAVGKKALAHQQIDLTEVDEAKINRNFLRVSQTQHALIVKRHGLRRFYFPPSA